MAKLGGDQTPLYAVMSALYTGQGGPRGFLLLGSPSLISPLQACRVFQVLFPVLF